VSVYAQEGSKSGGSVYAQRGTSGGSVYANRGGGKAPPKKGGGGGFWHGVERYSGVELAGHLAKDVGATAVGVGPGLYHVGRATGSDLVHHSMLSFAANLARGDVKAALDDVNPLTGQLGKKFLIPQGKQYKAYYGHDVLGHIYQHPLQPILDALTVASLGVGGAARAAKVVAPESKLAGLTERGTLETRSPRQAVTGKGPTQVDLTSTKPFVKLREKGIERYRRAQLTQTRPGGVLGRGGEFKQYGKGIQRRANVAAQGRLTPFGDYTKLTKGLSEKEWTALHIRAMDIHPADLRVLWRGKHNEAIANDPVVNRLVESPSNKMARAEPALRALSKEGERLLQRHGSLGDVEHRPGLTKTQAAEELGRPVKTITGDPYYFPHTVEPVPTRTPLANVGGGKAVPRRLGTTKRNLGILALQGKMHLRSDVLGPEFLRRVKYVKYDEVHNALVRGAVRLTKDEIQQRGGIPKGWEYIREKASTRVPFSLRREEATGTPLEQLMPKPEDLRGTPLEQGFTTSDIGQAHAPGGVYHIVPKATSKAATGEFTRSSTPLYYFNKYPMRFWRSAVLGLRVGFLTNNLVGNSIMYGVKTGGKGAIRDLFGAILESHGRDTALKILNSSATPPELRADLYREFFPEQTQGTFGRTQSPATSLAHVQGRRVAEAGRTVAGAIPRATSKLAEEYPRRALIRNTIRKSPEFRSVYRSMPKQTRSFEAAARQILEGKGGPAYQRYVSQQVNRALGDYLNLNSFERNVARNALPFYSWYRAIVTATAHLATDTPLRAQILGQIGQIGKQWSDERLGKVPSFLEGAIPLGQGPQGTTRALGTQGLNPYASLEQLRRGATGDFSSLGINPFPVAILQAYAAEAAKQHTPYPKVSLQDLVREAGTGMAGNLPLVSLLKPRPPSKLYPTRGRRTQLFGYLGAPVKEYNPAVARQQAAQGR